LIFSSSASAASYSMKQKTESYSSRFQYSFVYSEAQTVFVKGLATETFANGKIFTKNDKLQIDQTTIKQFFILLFMEEF
jgi:hypothetical protein